MKGFDEDTACRAAKAALASCQGQIATIDEKLAQLSDSSQQGRLKALVRAGDEAKLDKELLNVANEKTKLSLKREVLAEGLAELEQNVADTEGAASKKIISAAMPEHRKRLKDLLKIGEWLEAHDANVAWTKEVNKAAKSPDAILPYPLSERCLMVLRHEIKEWSERVEKHLEKTK